MFNRKKIIILVAVILVIVVAIFVYVVLKTKNVVKIPVESGKINVVTTTTVKAIRPVQIINGLTAEENKKYGLDGYKDFDTDHDGLADSIEIKLGTDPKNADTDGDGLADGKEVILGTNPLKADTDGDGYTDSVEVKSGYNPLGPGKK